MSTLLLIGIRVLTLLLAEDQQKPVDLCQVLIWKHEQPERIKYVIGGTYHEIQKQTLMKNAIL